jgi:LysR family glycine cleavage system transcriptional activator
MPLVRRNLPPLNALRAFEAFGRLGRMTAAADELFVTHGAVSRQIRQLEQWLGFPLTEGPKTQLKLTPEARRLLGASSAAFDLIGEAAARKPVGDQDLHLACYGTFAIRWLIPRLADFMDSHPDIRLHVREVAGESFQFQSGSADAAICLRSSKAPGEQETPFLANFYGPVMSPARAAALGGDPGGLLLEPRLHTRTWPQAWPNWAKGARVGLSTPVVERNFDHFSHALEAAAGGLGVAMAPWAFVADDLEAGRLVAPLGFIKLPGRLILTRPAGRANPAVDRFAQWLVEQGVRMGAPPKAVKLKA